MNDRTATKWTLPCFLLMVSLPGMGWCQNPIIPEIMLRKVAILDFTQRNNESQANVFSLEHAMQVAGVPYVVTDHVDTACECEMVMITSTVYTSSLTVLEKNKLAEYVWEGGVLVAPKIRDDFFHPMFGIRGYTQARDHSQLTWLVSNFPAMGRWLNDPQEIVIRLSNPEKYPEGLMTQSYDLQGAAALAVFEDQSAAVTLCPFGQGQAVALGFSVSDLISRNLLNNDLGANRIYSNGFEPGTDAFIFFLLSLAEQYIPYTVRKHTSPHQSRASLILTHDIDAMTSMQNMLYFVRMEQQRNIRATYFITTRYITDSFYKAYYTSETAELVKQLPRYGAVLGSHSVGHFKDFHQIEYGAPGNTPENYHPVYDANMKSVGATVYGECEVSKHILEADTGYPITSFRSGHLLINKYLINALSELGYLYDSSQSANDILTNFPHFTFYDKSTNSPRSNVIELPMTISDVYGDDFNELNYEEALAIWQDVIARNADNYAPTVLLIHPSKIIKLTAQERLLDSLPDDIVVMDLNSYGDFWRNRLALGFETELTGEVLTISIHSGQEEIDNRLSLTIHNGAWLTEIHLLWNDEPVYYYDLEPWIGDDVIISNIHLREFTQVEEWDRF